MTSGISYSLLPVSGRIVVDDQPSSSRISVLPSTPWHAAKFWCVLALLHFGLAAIALGGTVYRNAPLLWESVVLPCATGCMMLLGSFRIARQRIEFCIDPSGLTVHQSGWSRKRQQNWPLSDIDGFESKNLCVKIRSRTYGRQGWIWFSPAHERKWVVKALSERVALMRAVQVQRGAKGTPL